MALFLCGRKTKFDKFYGRKTYLTLTSDILIGYPCGPPVKR